MATRKSTTPAENKPADNSTDAAQQEGTGDATANDTTKTVVAGDGMSAAQIEQLIKHLLDARIGEAQISSLSVTEDRIDLPLARVPGCGLPLPARGTPGAACWDFRTNEDIVLKSGSTVTVGLGFRAAVPEGYVLLLFSRSGHGFKDRVRLNNCVGVIDSDYRGELRASLNSDNAPVSNFSTDVNVKRYAKGDRVVQGMLLRLPVVDIVEVEELPETERGEGGIGSTGNN